MTAGCVKKSCEYFNPGVQVKLIMPVNCSDQVWYFYSDD